MALSTINSLNSTFYRGGGNNKIRSSYYYKFLPQDLTNGNIRDYGTLSNNKYILRLNNTLTLNYYLNLNNQYCTTIDAILGTDITICFWGKFSTTIQNSVIFNITGENTNDNIVCDISNNYLRVYNNYINSTINSNTTINEGTWNHIICKITTTRWSIYINNIIDNFVDVTYNDIGYNKLTIGLNKTINNPYYNGYITEFMVYNKILESDLMTDVYNIKNLPLPVTNLSVTRIYNVPLSLYPTISFTDVNDGSRKGKYILKIYNNINVLLYSNNEINESPINIANYYIPTIYSGYIVGITVKNNLGSSNEIKSNVFYVVTGLATFSSYNTTSSYRSDYIYTNYIISSSTTFNITNLKGSFDISYFAVGGGGGSPAYSGNANPSYPPGNGGQCILNSIKLTTDSSYVIVIGQGSNNNNATSTTITGNLINIVASGSTSNTGTNYQGIIYGEIGSYTSTTGGGNGVSIYSEGDNYFMKVYPGSGAAVSITNGQYMSITNQNGVQTHTWLKQWNQSPNLYVTTQSGKTYGSGAGGISRTNVYLISVFKNASTGNQGVVFFTVNQYNIA